MHKITETSNIKKKLKQIKKSNIHHHQSEVHFHKSNVLKCIKKYYFQLELNYLAFALLAEDELNSSAILISYTCAYTYDINSFRNVPSNEQSLQNLNKLQL